MTKIQSKTNFLIFHHLSIIIVDQYVEMIDIAKILFVNYLIILTSNVNRNDHR